MGNVALKFYVKSILKILDRSSKTAFFAILKDPNFDVDEFLLFLRAEINPKSEFRVSKWPKRHFWGFKMTKLDFT